MSRELLAQSPGTSIARRTLHGGRDVWHVSREDSRTGCGKEANTATWRLAAEVEEEERCAAPGCRRMWPPGAQRSLA